MSLGELGAKCSRCLRFGISGSRGAREMEISGVRKK